MTIGIMEVTLVKAKDLKHSDFFDKMDPYVVMKYRNQEYTSTTATGQGKRPVWNEKFIFKVEYPPPPSQRDNKLFLEIMDRDTFTSDDYIGKATIYLKELFELGWEEGKADLGIQKYRVVLTDRTYHGEIQVGITFTAQGKSNSQEYGAWTESQY